MTLPVQSNTASEYTSANGSISTQVNILPLYRISDIPNRFRKVGDDLLINMIEKSPSHCTNLVFDKDNYNMTSAVEIKLATEPETAFRGIYTGPFFNKNTLEVAYADILKAFGSASFHGKECIIRLRFGIGNHIFYSNTRSFYYLDVVPVNIHAPETPKCVGDLVDVTFTLGVNTGNNGAGNLEYLYNIYEYTEDPGKACNCSGFDDFIIPDPENPAKQLYLKYIYQSGNIRVFGDSESKTLKLGKGIYRIKTYLLHEGTMYFPAEKFVRIFDPPQFSAHLLYVQNFKMQNDTFHIRVCDEEGELNAQFF
ncbi:MAG: hypothetical protein HC830_03765 [Bacteroidetes bacterium]|nr:hypothetical protein [Bacteroidota bacterium]